MLSSLSNRLLSKWKEPQALGSRKTDCFIGFDGFTDEILLAVESRESDSSYKAFDSIENFGKRISNAAGKSTNIELITKQTKIGGNAPIMTNALIEGGHRIAFAGTIGSTDSIEQLFVEMAKRCKKVYPLGPSGYSQAIEFSDGKIILGKHAALRSVTLKTILKDIGEENLLNELEGCKLFACLNWTMLYHMTELWTFIQLNIIPKLTPKERFMFVDLADPAKREDTQLEQAFEVLQSLSKHFKIILGLNLSEAERLTKLAKLPKGDREVMVKEIKNHYGFDQVIVHHAKNAVAIKDTTVINLPSFYTENPLVTTGAGDNFNAGFCTGLLYGFSLKDCLTLGLATSGYYVRKGQSPTMPELADFLDKHSKF